jgi:hypothetical protein
MLEPMLKMVPRRFFVLIARMLIVIHMKGSGSFLVTVEVGTLIDSLTSRWQL